MRFRVAHASSRGGFGVAPKQPLLGFRQRHLTTFIKVRDRKTRAIFRTANCLCELRSLS